jgi:RNA polymerase sigma factor (sigma-70 family)
MDDHVACVEAAVRAHQRRLIALAYAILHTLEQAKDEAQNAFIQLARRHCPSIENKEAWLVTVCRHSALKTAARSRRVTGLSEAEWETLSDGEGCVGAAELEKNERARLLFSHLDSLPEKQREVMRLHYVAGLKPAQIAEILGERPNNIHQLHFAGLASLRKKLGSEPARP